GGLRRRGKRQRRAEQRREHDAPHVFLPNVFVPADRPQVRIYYTSRARPRPFGRRMPASRLNLSPGNGPPRSGSKRGPSASPPTLLATTAPKQRDKNFREERKMSMLRARSLTILCGATVLALATGAGAQDARHYRFAHDQQLNSGYSVAYDIFSAKL